MGSDNPNKVSLILFDSYTQTVKNSIGSNMFKNLYTNINDGPKTDILEDGRLSCAYFASSLLYIFKLISDVHATVDGTVLDLEKSGWIEIDKPKEGAVLIWEPINFEGKMHRHVGFYMGTDQAISNLTAENQPAFHHWTYGIENGQPVRKVEKIYWNNKLG